MKKIIIMLATVATALGVQAAAANWQVSASNIYNGTDGAKYTGTAYFFDASVLVQSTLFEAFAAGTDLSSLAIATGTVNAGAMVYGSNKFQYGEQGGGNYSYFFALVEDDSIFLSKTMTVAANATATAKSLAFGNQASTSGASSKITTEGFQAVGQWASVPEPTSGLLLLLGMAGLALRRRA